MKFEGIVGTCDLPDIFQLISSSGRIGALVVTSGRRKRRVYFGADGITLPFDTEHSARLLGQILLARNIITEPQLHSALERQHSAKIPVGEILVNAGAATEEQVSDALTYQLREELFDLLTWEKATFEFEEGALPPTGAGRSYAKSPAFNTDATVMEAARRADEWKRIRKAVPSGRAVPVATPDAASKLDAESGDATRDVVSLADGACSIDEMVRILGRSEYETFEAVYTGMQAEALTLADARSLADLADAALKLGDSERARQLLAHATELAGDDAEQRYNLGLLSLWAGAEKDAAGHLDFVLAQLVEEDLKPKIAEMLDSVREQFPDCPWSYERRLKLLKPAKDFDEALPMAEKLLAIYDGRHDAETMTRMMRFLRRFTTHTPEQAEGLAKLLESRGDRAAAAQHYFLAARQARLTHPARVAMRLCEKAVALNPRHADAKALLDELFAGPRRERRRKMVLVASCAAALMIATLGTVQLAREWSASRAFARTEAAVAALADKHDYASAAAAWENFAREHARTLLAPLVPGRIAEIDSDRGAFLGSRSVLLADLRSEAEESTKAGDFPSATAAWEKLASLAPTPEDARKAGAALDALRSEREAFDAKVRSARAAESAGRLDEAVTDYLAAKAFSARLFGRDGVTIPLSVTSVPAGAEVLLNGRPVGGTPAIVRRAAASEVRIRLEGYNEAVLRIDADSARAAFAATLVPSRGAVASLALEGYLAAAPTALGSTAVFATHDGRLVGWDVAGGAQLFDTKLAGESGTMLAPAAGKDRFVAATLDGRVRGFDRATGRELWATPPAGLLAAPPIVDAQGRVVAARVGGEADLFDIADGHPLGTLRLPVSPLGELQVAGEFLAFAADPDTLIAFDPAERKTAWKSPAGGRIGRGICVADGMLAAVVDGRGLVAFRISDGRQMWTRPARDGRLLPPTASGSRIFLASANGKVVALDAESGRELWSASLDGAVYLAPAADADRVYVVTSQGRLTSLRASDGSVAWKTDLPSAAVWPALPASGRVVIVTEAGAALAFEK